MPGGRRGGGAAVLRVAVHRLRAASPRRPATVGLITGYYEPVIDGSRMHDARQPLSDLRRARRPDRRRPRRGQPGCAQPASARPRSKAGAWCPTGRAPRSTRAAACPAPVIAWTRGSGGALLPADPGLGADPAATTASACASASPTRTAIRSARSAATCVERGEMTLDQASMQSIKAWAAANPHKLQRGAQRQPELRLLPRAAGDASEGPIGALGVPLSAGLQPRGRPALRAARRAGVPRHHHAAVGGAPRAPDGGAGHRRRDPRRGARAISTGARAPRRARRRDACASRAKMWLLWPRGEPLPRDPSATCC